MSLSLLLCQRASQTGSFLYSSVQFTIWGNRSPGKQAAKLHPMMQQISSKRFSTMELRPCFSMLAILNGADHQSLRSRLGFFAMVQYTHNLSILIYLAPSVPRSTPTAKVRVNFSDLDLTAASGHW